jgi:cobyrinic acid a,c-diamide synthase
MDTSIRSRTDATALPRLVVAGTGSGVGKTTVATGLMAALADRGLRVQAFKVGPDFIDPSYHRLATGRPAVNLDVYFHGRDGVRRLLRRYGEGRDAAVIEGVMGLFDGQEPTSLAASTAEVAQVTESPVLLVLDAWGLAASAAAVVHGFASLVPDVHVAGVVLNRVGSPRHADLVRAALAAHGLPPVLGHLPADPALGRAERHLGLVPVAELADAAEHLERLRRAVAEGIDVEAVLARMRAAPPVPPTPGEDDRTVGARRAARAARAVRATVAYAWDEAFHFYYETSLDALRRLGAKLVPVSPLRDSRLPPEADGLYLGGGFPEVYATRLAENRAFLAALRTFTGPILAECGGLMLLARALTDGAGGRHEMAGRIPAEVAMGDGGFGYGEGELLVDTVLGPAGTRLRGHEFHRSVVVAGRPGALRIRRPGRPAIVDGFAEPLLLATYLHVDLAAHPEACRHFLALAAGDRRPGTGPARGES